MIDLIDSWPEASDKIRCNWCMKVFEENSIKIVKGKEYCPHCNAEGCLMDITEKEYQDQK